MEYKIDIYREHPNEIFTIIDDIVADDDLVGKVIRSETVTFPYQQFERYSRISLYTCDQESAMLIQMRYV